MTVVTTNRILAEKLLQDSCGQNCVDWAIGMLGQGRDTHHVLRLAGMIPPHNHFEIAELRDKALRELEIPDISVTEAITKFTVELLQAALCGETDMVAALAEVKELCIANDYQGDIMEFYHLYFALTDLQYSDVQWYWPGATAENISAIIRERATAFVESHPT